MQGKPSLLANERKNGQASNAMQLTQAGSTVSVSPSLGEC